MSLRIFLTRFTLLLPLAAAAATPPPPRLTVVISVDQMRGDYLERFGPHFVAGGFKRLLRDGVHFSNAHYRHAITHTGAGHATMLTGVHPNTHGIIGNDWHDRELWESVNCIEDPASPLVGIHPAELGPVVAANPAKTGRSARNLQADTIGDQLKRRYGPAAKVIGVANKDRAAVLMAGRGADAAYWDENGRMITARAYRASLPAWVEGFNAEKLAHGVFGATWDRLLPKEIYDRVQGPDDHVGENGGALGGTFPRRVDGGQSAPGLAYFATYDRTPFTTEHLGEFARRALREEQLGRDEIPDLLCIGFSQIDAIGHAFGPDSHEVMDSMLRLDRVLAELLDTLDREVGLQHCLIVLTADHGVAPTPERFLDLQPQAPAGRIRPADLDKAMTAALDGAFGPLPKGQPWFVRDAVAYHLHPAALTAKKVTTAAAAKVLQAALRRLPGIADAWTRDELLASTPDEADGSIFAMAQRAYHAARGRDVLFVLRPNFLLIGTPAGTSHGTPYAYDTHVVLLLAGRGVPTGVRREKVGIDALAPTLAPLLGVAPPPLARAQPLFSPAGI